MAEPSGSPDSAEVLAVLRASAPYFRHPVALFDASGAVTMANAAFLAMLGDGDATVSAPTGEEEIARALAERVPETKRETFVTDWDAAHNVARRGGMGECRLLDIAPNGAPRWLRFIVSGIGRNGDVLVEGSAIESAQIAVDTSVHLADGWRRKSTKTPVSLAAQSDALASLAQELRAERAERERRTLEAESRARALFTTLERISDAFYALDREGRFTYANAHALRLLRVERQDVLGRPLRDVLAGIDETPFGAAHEAAATTASMQRVEAYYAPLDAWLELTVYPSPTGLTVYFRDVTAERELRARTIATQRTEAMALLAGSIAHDFNNLLTALFGGVQLVRLELDPAHPAQADLAEAERTVQRAAHLSRHLLAFSRRRTEPAQPIDVSAVLDDLHPLLRRLAGEQITTGTDLAQNLPPVRMDPGLLEQALIDLVAHARGDMPSGGTLELRTELASLAAPLDLASGRLAPGEYVKLTLRDSAAMLANDVMQQFFRPDDVTDPIVGTGLGLLAVRGIVAQTGGGVDVYAAEGGGTVFALYLPTTDLATDGPAPADAPTESARASSSRDGRGEHVLLVEDEAGVRAITTMLLKRHGYRVSDARHGADGIEVWRANRADIDLVISDMRMPSMNGRELLAALRAEGARCPVLFISGYPLEVLDANEHPEEGEILAKPFEGRDLLARVRALLDASPVADTRAR